MMVGVVGGMMRNMVSPILYRPVAAHGPPGGIMQIEGVTVRCSTLDSLILPEFVATEKPLTSEASLSFTIR